MNAFMRHYHELNVDILTQDAVYDKIFLEHFLVHFRLSAPEFLQLNHRMRQRQ